LTLQLALAERRVQELVAFAYKGGDISEISAVLASADPAMVVDRLITLDNISRREREGIAQFAALKASHDAQVAQLQALIADQLAKRDLLAGQRKKINADLAALYELRRRAYGSPTTPGSPVVAPSPPEVSGPAASVVRYAYGALGKPYIWGAAGPNGYDCSGLTMAAWRTAGVSLPHNAAMQWQVVRRISRASLSPGDLVFYAGLGHVAIYVGGGKVIHAPTFGEVVHIASVDMIPPYGYGRPG
jgi:cell wall-associated NlpC family hydrolase